MGCPQPLAPLLTARIHTAAPALRRAMLEVMTRRYYRLHPLEHFAAHTHGDFDLVTADFEYEGGRVHVLTTHLDLADLRPAAEAVAARMAGIPADAQVMVDFYTRGEVGDADTLAARLAATLRSVEYPHEVQRFVVAVSGGEEAGIDAVTHFTYGRVGDTLAEDEVLRGLHPMMAERLPAVALRELSHRASSVGADVYLFRGVARDNAKRRAPLRDRRGARPHAGPRRPVASVALPDLERMFMEALEGIRRRSLTGPRAAHCTGTGCCCTSGRPSSFVGRRSRVWDAGLPPPAPGSGSRPSSAVPPAREPDQPLRDCVVHLSSPGGTAFVMEVSDPSTERPTARRVPAEDRRLRRRGVVYPYELLRVLAPATPRRQTCPRVTSSNTTSTPAESSFPCTGPGRQRRRRRGRSSSQLHGRYPEGIEPRDVLGDPTRRLGAIAEPECRRVIAALDLADRRAFRWNGSRSRRPRRSRSTAAPRTWTGSPRCLRRLIEFTQAGGEVNVVVAGINVGAQPYWNAEATMLMHTQGILVMTPQAAMVLTGKQALDYSGGVSADDNDGIGGYERIMGPNGQSQYWAADLTGACRVLLRHYEHAYIAPGERFPRRAATSDPADRDRGHRPARPDGSDFRRVGDVFSERRTPSARSHSTCAR